MTADDLAARIAAAQALPEAPAAALRAALGGYLQTRRVCYDGTGRAYDADGLRAAWQTLALCLDRLPGGRMGWQSGDVDALAAALEAP